MNYIDVVADSEGEELESGPSKATKALSSIETADTGSSDMRRVSSIDAASLGTSWTARPHGRQACDASTSARMLDMDFTDPLSIADRAKTRQRSTQRPSLATPGPSSRVPHPFDEDALFESYHVPDMLGGDDGEDYTTSHSKPKPRPKQKQKHAEVRDNLDSLYNAKIGYNSNLAVPAAVPSENGQPSLPLAQSRPKPRPIKRSPKANVDPSSESEPTINNNQEQQPTSQLSLPVPTSPLPPSDPPPPTLNYHSGSMPPIVTLPDPPSSPSSLFSIGDKGVELAGDAHIPSVDDDPSLMGPPSTFFTGSSSPDQPAQRRKPHSKPKLNEAVDIIDLCTAPPPSTDVQVLPVKKASSSKKGKEREHKESRGTDKSKTRAKGKRKARDEDEFGPHMDDDDDEYEESGKSKKAKAAVAKRAREKKAVASKKAIPEIVIDSRPRSTAKAPVKATANVAPDREAGKSRDDDREHHPLIPTLLYKAPARPPNLSVAVNNPGEPETPPNFVPDSEGEDDMEPNVVARIPLATPISGTKKRRNDVTSGEEAKAGEQEEEERSSPKKKARTRFRTQGQVKNNSTQPEENRSGQARQKGKRVVSSDEEGDDFIGEAMHKTPRKKATAVLSSDQDDAAEDDSIKENVRPGSSGSIGSTPSSNSKPKPPPPKPSAVNHSNDKTSAKPVTTSLTSRYTIAPKTKSTPMSELIKRVNSLPQTPSPAGKDRAQSALRTTPGIAYSPYVKASRSFLSKIAPLHPNRRTPPPPLPPPPPRKKSKKEIEREERWEEELIEKVGGPAAWSCLSEEDRKEMRRAKWAMEMGVDD